jgi:hypothetical protein
MPEATERMASAVPGERVILTTEWSARISTGINRRPTVLLAPAANTFMVQHRLDHDRQEKSLRPQSLCSGNGARLRIKETHPSQKAPEHHSRDVRVARALRRADEAEVARRLKAAQQ